jgi:hypothetical protein
VDELFANGDGTDLWCKNGTQMNNVLHYTTVYQPPVDGILTCSFLRLFTSPNYIQMVANSIANPCLNGVIGNSLLTHILCS